MLNAEAGIELAEISYKSGSQAVTDLLGGRVDMNVGVIGMLLPLLRAGLLRALAVTGERRNPDLPDVPPMAEAGYPLLTRGSWSALLAPAGPSAEIVNSLNHEISAIAQSSEMKASLRKLGFEPKIGSPEDFAVLLSDESTSGTRPRDSLGLRRNEWRLEETRESHSAFVRAYGPGWLSRATDGDGR